MAGRISQIVVEVGADGVPTGRVTQIVQEISAFGTPTGRMSQIVLEVGGWGAANTFGRVSQVVTEAAGWNQPNSYARASQLIIEVLVHNHAVPMPLLYPTLPGLTYSVIWRPKAVNAPVQTHTSGREVRVSYATYPLHEFELTYNFLRGRPGEIEQKLFMAFFLQLGGSLTGFNFQNPHDYSVTKQSLATTDGINSQFGPLVRTYGAGGYTWNEPVGYVDLTQAFNLYYDGALVDPNDATLGYSVLQTQPVNQMVKFKNTPPSGHVLTVDMSYFYYCRFADDNLDFEEFLWNLWQVKKVKLMSLRG